MAVIFQHSGRANAYRAPADSFSDARQEVPRLCRYLFAGGRGSSFVQFGHRCALSGMPVKHSGHVCVAAEGEAGGKVEPADHQVHRLHDEEEHGDADDEERAQRKRVPVRGAGPA